MRNSCVPVGFQGKQEKTDNIIRLSEISKFKYSVFFPNVKKKEKDASDEEWLDNEKAVKADNEVSQAYFYRAKTTATCSYRGH